MYAAVLFVGINNCSTVQPIVAVERTVFYRERAAGMYSALPYALAQVKSFLVSFCFSIYCAFSIAVAYKNMFLISFCLVVGWIRMALVIIAQPTFAPRPPPLFRPHRNPRPPTPQKKGKKEKENENLHPITFLEGKKKIQNLYTFLPQAISSVGLC